MAQTRSGKQLIWLLIGLSSATALGTGAFGATISTGTYSTHLNASFQVTFCGGAIISALAFLSSRYQLGATVGVVASGISVLLFVTTWRSLADAGMAGVAHPGWAFALTIPAACGFLFVFLSTLFDEDAPSPTDPPAV